MWNKVSKCYSCFKFAIELLNTSITKAKIANFVRCDLIINCGVYNNRYRLAEFFGEIYMDFVENTLGMNKCFICKKKD